MGDRKRFSIAYNAGHFSANLIRAERSFDFCLIVSDQIESVRSNAADPVKHKDALVTAVENDIAAAEPVNRIGFDDGLVPAGNKKRVHTVSLRLQLDGGTVL